MDVNIRMTNKEAITVLRNAAFLATDTSFQSIEEAVEIAIEALKRQIPEKTKRIITNAEIEGNFKLVCPSCGWLMFERVTTKDESKPVVYRICNFCQSCGQRIDWTEGEK